MSKTNNKETGNLGENIACKFLIQNSYKILERNYTQKFGEIDIIASKKNTIYFLEVKTNILNTNLKKSRPEERVDSRKLRQIGRVIKFYINNRGLKKLIWKFAVISIVFDPTQKTAGLKMIEDVVPE